MTAFVGIDPGLDGALAYLHGTYLELYDIPTLSLRRNGKSKRELDLAGLAHLMGEMTAGRTCHVYIEQVGAMPGQGVSSMFSFGKTYGGILGVVATLQLPHTLVAPATWKKAMGVKGGKDASRARASALLPAHAGHWRRVKDDGRAEAALIALYGQRQLHQEAA